MLLVNYKNEFSTNVLGYCNLAIHHANTKHSCRNRLLDYYKRTTRFLENYRGMQLSDL